MDTEEHTDENSFIDDYDEEECWAFHKYHKPRYSLGYNDSCEKCSMDQDYCETSSIQPVIITSVPKLTQMTFNTIAVALWNHADIPRVMHRVDRRCAKNSKKWRFVQDQVLESTKKLPLPISMIETVDKFVDKMAYEISKWVSYNYCAVFLKKGRDNGLYNLVYYFVWHPDGSVNYEQTARSLLTCVRLSEVEKFKFLTTYCLYDEMQKLSPLLFLRNSLDHVNFSQHPLIYYWYCYFRNELDKIPVDGNESLDSFMFGRAGVDNWPAKEYFIDRMPSDVKVKKAIQLISDHGVLYQKAVLMKLDEAELTQVYAKLAVVIMKNYAESEVNSEDVLRTWMQIRNLINEDEFVAIFCDLLAASADDHVMTQIWSTASIYFKNYLLNFDNHSILRKVSTSESWNRAYESDLLLVILQDTRLKLRKDFMEKRFFNKYCEKVLESRVDLSRVDRLINLCLSVESARIFKPDFIVNSPSVRKQCLSFYLTANIAELNDFLKRLLSAYPNVIVEFKKNLLTSDDGVQTCVIIIDAETELLNSIIADSLPNPGSVAGFKHEVMFSHYAITKLRRLITKGQLEKVVLCFDRYVPLADARKLKKQIIANPVETMKLILLEYDETYLQSVMKWCFEETWILEFKRTLPLDKIFSEMLTNCVLQLELNFDSLDRFLNWYFSTSKEVKEYKIDRANTYCHVEIINSLVKRRDYVNLKQVMKWLLQNDAAEIEKFKVRFSWRNKKITEIF